MLRLISLVLLGYYHPVVHANEKPKAEKYSFNQVAEDLNQRVKSIAQSEEGIAWLGTESGLFKYDGHTYTLYNTNQNGDRKLSFSNIHYLLRLEGNLLLIRGQRKVNIIDLNSEQVIYRSPNNLVFMNFFVHGPIIYLHFEDEKLQTHFYKYDHGVLTNLEFPGHLRASRWVINQEKQITFFDRDGNLQSIQFGQDSAKLLNIDFHGIRPSFLPDLFLDDDQQVWIGDYQGDNNQCIKLLGTDLKIDLTDKGGVKNLQIVAKDISERFVWFYNHHDHLLRKESLVEQQSKSYQLPSDLNEVNTVYEDDNGKIWVSGNIAGKEGLYLGTAPVKAFRTLLQKPSDNALFPVRGLHETCYGEILIGARDSLYVWSRVDKAPKPIIFHQNGRYLPLNNVWGMVKADQEGYLWLSKEEGGLYYLNLNDRLGKIFAQEKEIHVSNRLLGMAKVNNLIWIGAASGINWFDVNHRSFVSSSTDYPSFYEVRTYNWVQTDVNEIWACTSDGLYLFDTTRKIVDHFNEHSEIALNSQQVSDVVKDGEKYWIATMNGLYCLENATFKSYTTSNGLPSNQISSLLLDYEGNLWIATYHGLSRMDRHTHSFENYYKNDGLPHNEFNRLSKLVTSDSTFFFGGMNGVLYFKPQEVMQNDRENRLVLTNFSHFDQADQMVSTSTQDLNRLKNIVIPANNKYFQIDLALLSYVDSDLNKYTHYLEGLEDNWRPLQAQPSIQYNNLPQGRYTLHAKAISPTGKWSANEIVLGIIVKKAYYQQSWFYASLAALVASIFFLFYRNRAKQRLRLEKVRTALSRDLHDDVGGLLVGIALQMDIMQQQAPSSIKNQLSTIATTSRTAIRKMYDVLWAVDARNDHLGDLISHMQAYAIEFLEPLNIRFKFDTIDLNLDKRIAADVRQHLYLFYKECVHNAVKHSGTHEIHISIKYKKKKLHLEVRDFGQGLDVSKQSVYAGQGLQNLRARAKALKGKIQFLSDHGLSVLLSIKI